MARQLLVGLFILALAGTAAYYLWPLEEPVCRICLRPMHESTSYFVELRDGTEVELCCPRCGLRFQEGRDDVVSAEVMDFTARERLHAADAVYVVGSSTHPCCSEAEILKDLSGIEYERTWDRCLPSAIAFASTDQAKRFQQENGGRLANYESLRVGSDE